MATTGRGIQYPGPTDYGNAADGPAALQALATTADTAIGSAQSSTLATLRSELLLQTKIPTPAYGYWAADQTITATSMSALPTPRSVSLLNVGTAGRTLLCRVDATCFFDVAAGHVAYLSVWADETDDGAGGRVSMAGETTWRLPGAQYASAHAWAILAIPITVTGTVEARAYRTTGGTGTTIMRHLRMTLAPIGYTN